MFEYEFDKKPSRQFFDCPWDLDYIESEKLREKQTKNRITKLLQRSKELNNDLRVLKGSGGELPAAGGRTPAESKKNFKTIEDQHLRLL